jgi:hypothetical protein
VEQEVPVEEADADVDQEAAVEKSREFLLSEIGRLTKEIRANEGK